MVRYFCINMAMFGYCWVNRQWLGIVGSMVGYCWVNMQWLGIVGSIGNGPVLLGKQAQPQVLPKSIFLTLTSD